MKNSNDKWKFWSELSTRAPLSAEEVRYWKSTLPRILKVGVELEFNLPEGDNGICKSNNNACQCVKMVEKNDCWQTCLSAIEEECKTFKEDPKKCSGIMCSDFVSRCFICAEYERNCASCRHLYDPKKNPDDIRDRLTSKLAPNNTYGQVSKFGVHSVTKDGSLLGKKGVEIITTGRRIDYWEFYRMLNNIIEKAVGHGAYINERCSTHMHVLAAYYGKMSNELGSNAVPPKINEMERNMPEIIMANLHQLVRRYQNAMTWMMMGLHEQERLTRWEKFRVSVLPVSAVVHHMKHVKEEVCRIAGGRKYGWINYNNVGFSNDGDVERFHVEYRCADGLLSPSALSAIACLYYGLVVKAVEISRFGVLEIGDKGWLKEANIIKNAIMNNMKNWDEGDRFSNTAELMKYKDILVAESFDLVRQLKSILIKVGPAYEVLEKLAEKPCAIRRMEGTDWKQIEEDLKVITSEEDEFNLSIKEMIVLNKVSECTTEDEWVSTVSKMIPTKTGDLEENPETRIRRFINETKENGELVWSSKIGAPILI